jgi:hypothetical protein
LSVHFFGFLLTVSFPFEEARTDQWQLHQDGFMSMERTSEQQLTNWSGFAWAGNRDVGSKCSIRYMECRVHSHRAADMCTALLWLATHACSISHCPGVKSLYHISLLELSEKLYFCLGNGTLETNTDVSVV